MNILAFLIFALVGVHLVACAPSTYLRDKYREHDPSYNVYTGYYEYANYQSPSSVYIRVQQPQPRRPIWNINGC